MYWGKKYWIIELWISAEELVELVQENIVEWVGVTQHTSEFVESLRRG